MLQELAAQTGASAFAIVSMLFFLGVWVAITVRVFTTRRDELDARARLALEGDENETPGLQARGSEMKARGSDIGASSDSERRPFGAGGTEA